MNMKARRPRVRPENTVKLYQAIRLINEVFPGCRVAGGGRVADFHRMPWRGWPQAEQVHKEREPVDGVGHRITEDQSLGDVLAQGLGKAANAMRGTKR
jgi:hypothetical protein